MFGFGRQRKPVTPGAASGPATGGWRWRLPAGDRVYAIGDVHGCDDLLARLLAKIDADVRARPAARVTLVTLGDYIDRGLRSADVLRRLQGRIPFAARFVALMGNHEAMLTNFIADPGYLAQWRHFGGLETLASYGVDTRPVRANQGFDGAHRAFLERVPRGDLDFVAGLHQSFVCGDYFFSHAGARPGVSLAAQTPQDLLWIRDEFLSSAWDFGRCVVHGHSPFETPEVRANRINVDTGAYATGRLTCVVLEGITVSFLVIDRLSAD